jgi:hypothetical protein
MATERGVTSTDDLNAAAEALLEGSGNHRQLARSPARFVLSEPSTVREHKAGGSRCRKGRRDRIWIKRHHSLDAMYGLGPSRVVVKNEDTPTDALV